MLHRLPLIQSLFFVPWNVFVFFSSSTHGWDALITVTKQGVKCLIDTRWWRIIIQKSWIFGNSFRLMWQPDSMLVVFWLPCTHSHFYAITNFGMQFLWKLMRLNCIYSQKVFTLVLATLKLRLQRPSWWKIGMVHSVLQTKVCEEQGIEVAPCRTRKKTRFHDATRQQMLNMSWNCGVKCLLL